MNHKRHIHPSGRPQHEPHQPHQPYRPRWGLSVLLSAAAFTLCFAGGYGLSDLLFRFTGRPSGLWATVVAGLLGVSLFALGVKLLVWYGTRSRRRDKLMENARSNLMGDAIAAMERIARGDFSVFLPVDEHNPFSGIAESVNKMARELGTMENLRQDFVSNVSHELQSPLTSIIGFAALLKSDSLTPEQRTHYIDVIETEARRLSKLSENLLRLSSLESSAQPLNPSSFSLDRQIRNAALALEPQWTAKNLELSLSLDRLEYVGDEGLLTQVWVNLLHNAVKFTPEGGSITVTLTNAGKQAVCAVADTGAGFPEEDRLRLFERFYKADKSRDRALGGSGLGLSIVKKIVELHGGAVSAQSEPGRGSVFTVTLPLRRP